MGVPQKRQGPAPVTELSCIIPAYNEAPRIAAVLEAVLAHPLITEVIVVDDGSQDNTAEVAERYLAQHPQLLMSRLHRAQRRKWAPRCFAHRAIL